MVHGVGPGTTAEANFAPLIEALAPDTPAHLIDLAGFGGSVAAAAQPGFDAPLWLEQIDQALDRIGRPAILVGNSVGGALALKTAARRRDLIGTLVIGAPVAATTATPQLRAFWRAPTDLDALVEAMRPMSAAQAPPPEPVARARWRIFADPAYGAWFNAALAQPDDCLASVALTPSEAGRIETPTVLLHGQQDRACPPAGLATFVTSHMPYADLHLLGDCGHTLINERTADVLAAISLLRRKAPHS